MWKLNTHILNISTVCTYLTLLDELAEEKEMNIQSGADDTSDSIHSVEDVTRTEGFDSREAQTFSNLSWQFVWGTKSHLTLWCYQFSRFPPGIDWLWTCWSNLPIAVLFVFSTLFIPRRPPDWSLNPPLPVVYRVGTDGTEWIPPTRRRLPFVPDVSYVIDCPLVSPSGAPDSCHP